MPDPPHSSTVAELEGSEAARLFLERASDSDPCFMLTPDNAKAVGEVCRELAGIPLAIELAAARVGALSIEQIDRSLKARSISWWWRRTAPRHRTLRGSMDWSYELLSKPEQTLFGRLWVFAGGWTLGGSPGRGGGRGCRG